jgi:hypothetical protein
MICGPRCWLLMGWFALAGCVGRPLAVPDHHGSPAGPHEVLAQFLAAAQAGDFGAVHELLSARWRARIDPARLASDFAAEPLARRRLERAAAAGRLDVGAARAELPLGDAGALVLVKEAGGWRIDQLE